MSILQHLTSLPGTPGLEGEALGTEPFRQTRQRLTLIGDREIANLESLLAAGRDAQYPLEVKALIVPGFEADWLFMSALPRLFPDPRGILSPLWESSEPMSAGEAVRGTEPRDFEYNNPATRQTFQFRHEGYDAAELKSRGDVYRAEYCARLLKTVQDTNPDYILLSNFKLVLDRSMAAAFAGRIINIHPSVLPQLKGWRSENRAANLNEWIEASGYTIHNVSADLDGGATYFQQHVQIPATNSALRERLGDKRYADYREEVLRAAIISAQSQYAPAVLALVASDLPRKTVQDAEAFAAEQRPGFEHSAGFLASMEEDFAHWRKGNAGTEMSLSEWQAKHRRPYERVLFQNEGAWRTAEEILAAPATVEIPANFAPHKTFQFELPLKALEAGLLAAEMVEEATGGNSALQHRLTFAPSANGTLIQAEVSAPLDLVLEARGVAFEAHAFSVSVRTPRLTQSAIDVE